MNEMHTKIINTIVNKKCKWYPFLDREEIVSSANEWYAYCLTKYKKEINDNFYAYLYNVLDKAVVRDSFMMEINKKEFISFEENDKKVTSCDDYILNKVALFKEIDTLSSKAKDIINVIFSDSNIIEISSKNITGISQRKLKKYLSENGWKGKEITSAFNEIKTMLKKIK